MIFVDQMKNLKIYKKPMFLPTLETDKKKHSAVFLLTPNYESSKRLMNHPMIVNRNRFQSYYLEPDLSYYISGKVNKKVIKEEYVRECTVEDIYQNLCEMSSKERNRLKPNQFGLPSKRKYPLDTEKHVRSAVRFFNYVDKEDEEELADNIIKAIKKFDIKISIGENNRLSNYYQSNVNEAYLWNNDNSLTKEPKEFNAIYISYNKDEKCVDEDLCYINIWHALRNFVQMHDYEDNKPAYVSVLDKGNVPHIIGIIDIVDKGEEVSWKWIETYPVEDGYCPYTESGKLYDSKSITKEYGYEHNGLYNSIVEVEGFKEKFRGRSEVLIIRGDYVYLSFNKDGYKIPGGSWDRNEDRMYAAKREAEEESRIIVKNIRSNGSYLEMYDKPKKWVLETIPKEYQWTGYYTELYIAEYDKRYTGYIADEDKDDIIKTGKFYKISDVYKKLNKYHQQALAPFAIDLLQESLDMINTPENPIEASYGIITNAKGEILVQYNNLINGYHLPGGHVTESDEKIHKALTRECKEELGIELIEKVRNVTDIYIVNNAYTRANIYTILNYRGEIQNLEPEYCDRLEWISRDELFYTDIPCSKALKLYLTWWNREEVNDDLKTSLSPFIKFSGYRNDVIELSNIITPEVYYNILTNDLNIPISSVNDIPTLSYEITNYPVEFTSDNNTIYIKVKPYDKIGKLEDYIKDIIRQTCLCILYAKYPECQNTYLADILVDDITGLNTIRSEYAKFLFTEISIHDYKSVLAAGDISYVVNLLSKRYPGIRKEDLIKQNEPVTEGRYTLEYSVDLSTIFDNHVTITEAVVEFEDSSCFSEDALYGMDYLKLGDNHYTFFDESAANDTQLRQLLYNERLRQRGDVLLLLKKVKEENPDILYAYPDLEKYKSRNVFLDLYFYNELFFKNNMWKMNKGLNLYMDLLTRLVNDPKVSKNGYTKKTIFVPIMDWYKNKSTKMWMYREDINPISIIYELMRTESDSKLKSLFGDMDIVFFSKTSIFKMNFSELEDIKKDANKFRLFITTICNNQEFDAVDIDTTFDNKESSREIKANLIDKIESSKGVDLTGKAEIAKDSDKEYSKKVNKDPNYPTHAADSTIGNLKDDKSVANKSLEKNKEDINLTKSANDEEFKGKELDSVKVAKAIDKISRVATDTEDALDKLDQDIDLKSMLISLGTMRDETVKIDATRAARMNELDKQFLDKNINGRSIRDILDEKNDNKKLEETKLEVASPNEEWKSVSYMNFDRDYNLEKDILACFYHFTKTSKPVAIRTVNIEDNSTSEDRLDLYTVEMEDFRGTRFTVKLDIPRMKDNRMLLRGNTKSIQTQFFNMPIIKTAVDACQIVTNYQKIFIYRVNEISGRSNPIAGKFLKAVKKYEGKKIKFITGDNSKICSKYELPVDYTDIASVLSKIETDNYIIYFNQDEFREEYPNIDDSYGVPYGINKKDGSILYYNMMASSLFANELVYLLSDVDNTFYDLYSSQKVMKGGTFSRCNILNTKIPLVIICGYCEGLTQTLNKAKIEYSLEEKLDYQYKDPSSGYDYIKFKDGYLRFRTSYVSLMLLNGLRDSDVSEFSMTDIDNKSMYLELLDNYGGRMRSDGLDNFYDCLVDPMTKEALEYYGLPTDFVSILLYANLLLCDNKFIKHTDSSSRRIRRTELIAAYAYEALSEAYGTYSNMIKHGKAGATISLKSSAVIDKILTSPVSSDDSIINALNAVETTNSITFKGKAGLNSDRSYSLDKRTYDDSMLNVLGMSTGFSANVGITRQATMDMNIEGIRGYIKPINSDTDKLNAAKTLCATEALTPFGTTHDDAPRTYMTFIQTAKHMARTEESDPLLITNGADEALPYMTTDKFAFKAKMDGRVKEITPNYVIVEYDNKTKEYINLNETVEKNSDGGYYVPLKLEKYPELKVGSKVKKNQILAYDPYSFSNSLGESDNMSYNIGKLVKVAVINTDEGFEDSGFCTERLSQAMATRVIEKEEHVIDKDANVFYIAKVGQQVEVEDNLIVWQDPHEEEDANTLLRIMGKDKTDISELGRKTIKSEMSGTVVDIKIYRTVEIEDLSPSLQEIVKEYEKPINELKAKLESEGISSKDLPATYKLAPTGKLKKAQEAIYIEFYLEYKDSVAVGDKIVYFSANKAIIKNILDEAEYPYTDFRPNEPVDAFVSEVSISKRIVTSSVIDGSINKLLIEMDRTIKDKLGIKYDDSKV